MPGGRRSLSIGDTEPAMRWAFVQAVSARSRISQLQSSMSRHT
jgi:hypothetical protein